MVNYIHPTKDSRQLDTMLDYSTLILEKGNSYSGLVLTPHLRPNYELEENFSPRAPKYQSMEVNIPQYGPAINVPTGTRVAARRAPFGSAVATTRVVVEKQTGIEPKITYRSKNPEFYQDLPAMQEHEAVVTEEGITLDNASLSSDEEIDLSRDIKLPGDADYDIALETSRAQEMDKQFQEFLAQQALSQAKFRKERLERDARIAKRVEATRQAQAVAERRRTTAAGTTYRIPAGTTYRIPAGLTEQVRTARQAVSQATRGQVSHNTAPSGPGAVAPKPVAEPRTAVPPGTFYRKPVLGRFPTKPTKPVVPNDSDAGATQSMALRQAKALAAGPPTPQTARKPRVSFAPTHSTHEAAEDRTDAGPPDTSHTAGAEEEFIGAPSAGVHCGDEEQAATRTNSLNELAYAAEQARETEN
jgi:hypothetical protein